MEVSETRQKARDYLATLEKANLTPNFLMSEEYLEKSGAEWIEDMPFSGFCLPDSEEWLIPPIRSDGGIVVATRDRSICAGLLDRVKLPPMEQQTYDQTIFQDFWDYQIIYNPKHFLKMEGHPWATFRKNVKKYPKRNGWEILYLKLNPGDEETQVGNLIVSWAKGREVYDNETMVRFVLQGEHRMGLFCDGTLVGMNVWDENWKYINFRYCIDNGSPFLQEYLRYRFYTDPEIQAKNKLVNDGGALGSEDLLRFKMKLNPVQVLKVYSVKPK